jgi:non-canonical (house-cleaning) NTP pyrophosphatase
MFKVFVGSTRRAKVDAAVAAIEAIATIDERFRGALVHAVDVTDIAPTMPMTDLAILDGARLRAQTLIDRSALSADTEISLAIGLEGGLDPLPGDSHRFVLRTWAAATDGERWGYGSGGAIVLPTSITRQVLDGRELGEVIDEVARKTVRNTNGTWGVLTLDMIARGDSFTFGLLAALAPFYNPALYD